MMLSQPRVFLAMARDGLVPPSFFGAVHPRFRTPVEVDDPDRRLRRPAGRPPAARRILADLTNIGTLFAFVIVCAAVLIMRQTHPDAERPFRCPLVAAGADPRHPHLPAADVLAAGGELVAAVRLAGARLRHLLRLRRHAQRPRPADGASTPASPGTAPRSSHRRIEPDVTRRGASARPGSLGHGPVERQQPDPVVTPRRPQDREPLAERRDEDHRHAGQEHRGQADVEPALDARPPTGSSSRTCR